MKIPEAIYFEENFEAQLASRVEQLGFKASKARESESFTSNTIDVLFELGEAFTDDERIINDHTTEYMSYTGVASLICCTNRARKTVKHSEVLARLRWLMLRRNKALDSSNYALHDIRALASQYNTDEENNLDITILQYEIVFSIRNM